jgi:hypothetical protein
MDETTLRGVIDESGSLIRNFTDTQEGPARFNKLLEQLGCAGLDRPNLWQEDGFV